MSEPIKIIVTVEGGVIQAVDTLGLPCHVLVIDHDTDGATKAELTPIPSDDGQTDYAFVHIWDAVMAQPGMIALADRLFPEHPTHG